MRLNTKAQLERQSRKSRWAMESLVAANKRRSAKALLGNRLSHRTQWVRVTPPERLVFHASRVERERFERFVRNVERSLAAGNGVVVDFTDIKRLYPCGLLLLMGLIKEWLSRHPGLLRAKYPKDDLAEQMLQHVSVLQDLGLQPRKQVTHNDVNRWHYLSGRNVDTVNRPGNRGGSKL